MKYFSIGTQKISKYSHRLYNLLILLIINYPLFIIFITVITGAIISFLGIWFSPKFEGESPFSGFITRGTPIASNRLTKAKLNKMLSEKDLYQINDMIKYYRSSDNLNSKEIFKRFDSLADNYASVSSFLSEDGNSDYEIIGKVLNHVRPNIQTNKLTSFKREAALAKIKSNKRFKKKVTKPKVHHSFVECNPVFSEDCSQIIIHSKDPVSNSIMSFESILVQCQFIEQFLKPHFRSVLANLSSSHEILFESLPGSIAKFSRKKVCTELDKENVENFTLIFKYCAPIYHNLMEIDLMKHPSMEEANQLQLSPICRDKNLFDTFKYLVEKDFVNKNPSLKLNLNAAQLQQQLLLLNNQNSDDLKPPEVKYSNIYMSISKNDSEFLLPFYYDYLEPNFLYKPLEFSENVNTHNKNFQIIAVNFDIKTNLFFIYLRPNLNWLILISIFIFTVVAIYTQSISLVGSILICTSFSLMQSYAIYKLVFNIEFFSFLNILHLFFSVAVAADSLFILNDTWNDAKTHYMIVLKPNNNQQLTQTLYRKIETKSKVTTTIAEERANEHNINNTYVNNDYNNNNNNNNNNNGVENQEYSRMNIAFYLEKCLNYFFVNTFESIILKQVLIFFSFLINLNSSIIIIKLFGVYISICILINLMLLYIIVPSILTVQVKYSNYFSCAKFESLAIVKSFFCPSVIVNIRLFLNNIINQIGYFYNRIFEKWLPDLIISLRYVLITFLISLSILGLVIIFYKPSLRLPISSSLQFFQISNPIEYYDRYLSKMSASNGIFLNQNDNKPFLEVSYIFGLSNKDTESKININKMGQMNFDFENFNFYDEKTQLWLYQFCKGLKSENSNQNGNMIVSVDDYDKESKENIESSSSESTNLELHSSISQRKKVKMIRYTSSNLDDRLNQLDNSLGTNETFVDYDYSNKKICLLDLLKKILGRKCATKSIEEEEEDFIDSVCCDQNFPFDPKVLEMCLKNSQFLNTYISINEKFLHEKLYFNKSNGVVSVVEYKQTLQTIWTPDYNTMLNAYKSIEEFFKKHLKYVIVDLTTKIDSKFRKSFASNAFLVSEFDFLDYQISLASKTIESTLILFSVFTVLILLATRNILLTILILFSSLMNNATTFSILTLLGWQLNAIESACILLSISLSIGSMVHFATAYRKIINKNLSCDTSDEPMTIFFKREYNMKLVIKYTGSTFFISCVIYMCFGFLILTSFFNLYILQSFGLFLFLISFFNIFYGFFLFLPTLSIIGPINNLCKIKLNRTNDKNKTNDSDTNFNQNPNFELELENNKEKNLNDGQKSSNTSYLTASLNAQHNNNISTITTSKLDHCSMVLTNF